MLALMDFENALSKLKRSLSEKGRKLAHAWEWNDEFGEIKKEKIKRLPQLMNIYQWKNIAVVSFILINIYPYGRI